MVARARHHFCAARCRTELPQYMGPAAVGCAPVLRILSHLFFASFPLPRPPLRLPPSPTAGRALRAASRRGGLRLATRPIARRPPVFDIVRPAYLAWLPHDPGRLTRNKYKRIFCCWRFAGPSTSPPGGRFFSGIVRPIGVATARHPRMAPRWTIDLPPGGRSF